MFLLVLDLTKEITVLLPKFKEEMQKNEYEKMYSDTAKMIEPVEVCEAARTFHSGTIDPGTLESLSNMIQVTIKDRVLIFKLYYHPS